MAFLKVKNQEVVTLNKPYFSVGEGMGFDLNLPGAKHQILFTVHQELENWFLTPGTVKVWINGRAVTRNHPLQP